MICIPLEEYKKLVRKEKRCKKLLKRLRLEYNRRVFLDSSLESLINENIKHLENKRRIWEI